MLSAILAPVAADYLLDSRLHTALAVAHVLCILSLLDGNNA